MFYYLAYFACSSNYGKAHNIFPKLSPTQTHTHTHTVWTHSHVVSTALMTLSVK